VEGQSINRAAAGAETVSARLAACRLADLVTRLLTVCLAGVPNAGKTALMNGLTGGGFHTANYPGATVTLSRGKSRPELGPQVNNR
jgi:GTP1/Obg family GTP-binding protein